MHFAISFHALVSLASISLIFAIGIRNIQKYQRTGRKGLFYHALIYFSGGIAFLLALIPTLLHSPNLFLPFLISGIAIVTIGITAFLITMCGFYSPSHLLRWSAIIGSLVLGTTIEITIITFPPHIEILDNWTRYVFPHVLRIPMIVLFAVSMAAVGATFLYKTLTVKRERKMQIKGMLLGGAYLFQAVGVLLVILGETVIFNFFLLSSYLIIFLATIFEYLFKP